jgi:hypothetical protein
VFAEAAGTFAITLTAMAVDIAYFRTDRRRADRDDRHLPALRNA